MKQLMILLLVLFCVTPVMAGNSRVLRQKRSNRVTNVHVRHHNNLRCNNHRRVIDRRRRCHRRYVRHRGQQVVVVVQVSRRDTRRNTIKAPSTRSSVGHRSVVARGRRLGTPLPTTKTRRQIIAECRLRILSKGKNQ